MLDLYFCMKDNLVFELVVVSVWAGSDHHMVWCTIGTNVSPEVARPRAGPMEPEAS